MTKEMSNINSLISTVYAQLCFASFFAETGKQVLMSYLSTVIPKAFINYSKQNTGDHLDNGLDYKDDDKDDPEIEDIYMSSDWK